MIKPMKELHGEYKSLNLGDTALGDLMLRGAGEFKADFASFCVRHYFLPCEWDYILGDEKLCWRISHNGCGQVQPESPDGRFWLHSGDCLGLPPWLVYLVVDRVEPYYFTNFWGPRGGAIDRFAEPDLFECHFSPERAWFRVQNAGISVETELAVLDGSMAIMQVELTNHDNVSHELTVLPAIRPSLALSDSSSMPDAPTFYQSARYEGKNRRLIFKMGACDGNSENRLGLQLLTDMEFSRLCLSSSDFVGRGVPGNPEALSNWENWISAKDDAELCGEAMFAAFAEHIALKPGQSRIFTMTLTEAELPVRKIRNIMRNFESELDIRQKRLRDELSRYEIRTPDGAFNRYVNEFLPFQQWSVLHCVVGNRTMHLRHLAQDYTSVVAWMPERSAGIIAELLESQDSEGWFPDRIMPGKCGLKGDTRLCPDAGLWVWELVYEYICQNRDFIFLTKSISFSGHDKGFPVFEHLRRLLDYYLKSERLGEHGLCVSRTGDWNSEISATALAVNGESVILSCHLILCLEQAVKLLAHLLEFIPAGKGAKSFPRADEIRGLAGEWASQATRMRDNIRAHAMNERGFLNGIYSDGGKWFFSSCDPDGKARLSIPVNAFGVLAGVFRPDEIKTLFAMISETRTSYGYPLFSPPLGSPPFSGLGSVASGDLQPGLGANAGVCNYASHGLLARAAAAANDGEMLLEALEFVFPYKQEKHPVEEAHTAPYAIVDAYFNASGHEGEGGNSFPSAVIAAAFRNVYQGMLGVLAEPAGLIIKPCFPKKWPEISGKIRYAGKSLKIIARRENGKMHIFVNGSRLKDNLYRP